MFLRLSIIFLGLAALLHADELTKSVQDTLKEQGFYYGEITGINSPETAAAVKRYQIRNGLEVTGTFTKQTLESLGLAGDSSVPPALPPPPPPKAVPPPAPVEPAPAAPNHLRKDETVQRSDREYLSRQAPPPVPDESNVPPPTGGPLAHVFGQTPYASAPLEVQQTTIRQAQRFLANLDMYDAEIDGIPGPRFEEGLLRYQRFIRLPLTGQLDLETLAAMRLLPGRGGFPSRADQPRVRRVPGQPLRGVWID